MSEQVTDSPTSWVADHIHKYVESGGEDGHIWNGYPTLLITTRGRKSGKLRRSALIYGEYDGGYVIVASKGGAPEDPLWYRNLQADPKVEVQVRDEVFTATAQTIDGPLREQLWKLMAQIYPPYDEYQTKTDRQIPVVLLTRV